MNKSSKSLNLISNSNDIRIKKAINLIGNIFKLSCDVKERVFLWERVTKIVTFL